MKTYILYHSQCYDGFGAAFAAWFKFGNEATYIAVSYGKPMPEMQDGSAVYILDFHYDAEDLKTLSERMKKVVVLDHHISAMKKWTKDEQSHYSEYSGNIEIHFDIGRSGAGMAWDYFHEGYERPDLINLIEDRDLWIFKYGHLAKSLHSYLLSIPMDFDEYHKLLQGETLANAIKQGEALSRMTEQVVNNICKNSWVTDFMGHRVAMVNTGSHWSEVGNRLLELHTDVEFAVSYTDMPDGNRMYSLRSKGDTDVSLIAKKLNGGGHKNAAGAKVNNKEIIALELEKASDKYYDYKKETKSTLAANLAKVEAQKFIEFYRSLNEKTKT